MKTLITIILFGLTTHFGFGQITVLGGRGESGIAGCYNYWTIKISNNDSIEMLCSMKENSLDTRSMNRQYFGHIIPSDHYDYKVIINKTLYVDDCNKPFYHNFKSDSILFYIDSKLFKEVKFWDLEIKRFQKEDTIIRITNTFYSFYVKETNKFTMNLYPEKESGYFPISIKTGKRCAVYIGNHTPEMDYYINKTNSGYELITDITLYVNMQNEKCEYCIKKTNLKIKK